MNIYGFTNVDAILGMLLFAWLGMFFGFFVGFIRFLLFSFIERRIRFSSWASTTNVQ